MSTRMQTDVWIYRTAFVLGSILVVSLLGILLFLFTQHSVPGALVTLGSISAAGLAKLLISPLNWGL